MQFNYVLYGKLPTIKNTSKQGRLLFRRDSAFTRMFHLKTVEQSLNWLIMQSYNRQSPEQFVATMLISTINNISLMLCSRIHSRDIVCYQEADVRSHFINGRVTRFPGFLTVIGNSFLNLIQNGWSRVEIKRKKLKRMTQ